jgi:formate hydrogenlyase subunit 6/NADH:ubiquinone oxidoreductase subunit I
MTVSRESFADRVRSIPVIQWVIDGLEERAYEDKTTWLCSACDLCYPACPQEIHISDVLKAVRDLAVEAGHTTVLKTAAVNELTCVACGLCVSVCPYEAISLEERRIAGHTRTLASVDPNQCMACGLCAASCRSASIEVRDMFSNDAVMEDMWGWIQHTQPAQATAVTKEEAISAEGAVATPSRIN